DRRAVHVVATVRLVSKAANPASPSSQALIGEPPVLRASAEDVGLVEYDQVADAHTSKFNASAWLEGGDLADEQAAPLPDTHQDALATQAQRDALGVDQGPNAKAFTGCEV